MLATHASRMVENSGAFRLVSEISKERDHLEDLVEHGRRLLI
jgi:hypothetical protein